MFKVNQVFLLVALLVVTLPSMAIETTENNAIVEIETHIKVQLAELIYETQQNIVPLHQHLLPLSFELIRQEKAQIELPAE